MSELNSNIYLNSANKNWVVDRFRKEWVQYGVKQNQIISTKVGLSQKILSKESIYEPSNPLNTKPNTINASNNVQKYKITEWIKEYKEIFNSL